MDINKVWISGVVVEPPVQSVLASQTPSTVFKIQVNEEFVDRYNITHIKPNIVVVESLGKSAEKTFKTVKQGQRYTIDGYIRVDTVDGKDFVKIRTFAVYPDRTSDALCYREGLKQALEIIKSSRDLNSALSKLEDLLKK